MAEDAPPHLERAAFELRRVARTADRTHEYVHDQGFLCEGCGHRHSGAPLAFVCIGCVCAHRAITIAEFERMRTVEFNLTHTYGDVQYVPPAGPAGPTRSH
jgi:hypothetical protein